MEIAIFWGQLLVKSPQTVLLLRNHEIKMQTGIFEEFTTVQTVKGDVDSSKQLNREIYAQSLLQNYAISIFFL